ncbi:hypothetical protein, partial [Pseudoxanthomonas sp.]|uniref:hypothetical protein n=1 Tax=Pseudoxanthomonas sp. TaxID=1871049 RepID=UPI0028C48FA3
MKKSKRINLRIDLQTLKNGRAMLFALGHCTECPLWPLFSSRCPEFWPTAIWCRSRTTAPRNALVRFALVAAGPQAPNDRLFMAGCTQSRTRRIAVIEKS